MRVVITGARGFVGRNLAHHLSRSSDFEVVGVDVGDAPSAWVDGVDDNATLVHLAGINRPATVDGYSGNAQLMDELVEQLESRAVTPQVLFASSIQAELDNPYGASKRAAERRLARWVEDRGGRARNFRLPNVFGKWCRPNYNSAIATFCHNTARGLPINVHDRAATLRLVYVDDVVGELERCIRSPIAAGYQEEEVQPSFSTTVGEIVDLIAELDGCCRTPWVPDVSDPLRKRMLATFVSYLPADRLSYGQPLRTDPRGTLVEVLKSRGCGQVFVSTTKPGACRGNHYHDTKVEKFCVFSGKALIEFRGVESDEVVSIEATDGMTVNIPPGHTHSISNVGEGELVVVFWASEEFDPTRADTYPCAVRR